MAQKGPILVLVPFFPTLICRNCFSFPSLLRPRRSDFCPGNSRVTSLPEGRIERSPDFSSDFLPRQHLFAIRLLQCLERKKIPCYFPSLSREGIRFLSSCYIVYPKVTLYYWRSREKKRLEVTPLETSSPRSSSSSPFVIISNNFPSSSEFQKLLGSSRVLVPFFHDETARLSSGRFFRWIRKFTTFSALPRNFVPPFFFLCLFFISRKADDGKEAGFLYWDLSLSPVILSFLCFLFWPCYLHWAATSYPCALMVR